MAELSETLVELRAEIHRRAPEIAARLRPGLRKELIRQKLASLPFAISQDAVHLYSWADGADGRLEFLPGHFFLPLDCALDESFQVHAIRTELESVFHQKYRDCFRFLTDYSNGGEAFTSLTGAGGGRIAQLTIDAEWQLAFEDAGSMAETALECWRKGIIPAAGVNDFAEYHAIARRLNPQMERWSAT